MGGVRIVTDSTSDVPAEIASELGITIVPAYVQLGNESYRDRVDLSRESFYERLPDMQDAPTTAVPPIDDFAAAYRQCADKADEVVAILVSDTLSGMCSAARVAARQVPELKVHVVDSGQVSMGLGWMVIAAAEAAALRRGTEEILAAAQAVGRRLGLFAMLDTLDHLRRSGRVSWARAEASRILRIKPIVRVAEGEVAVLARTRTRRRAVDHMGARAAAMGPLERLAVLHTLAPEVDEFRQRLAGLCGATSILTVLVTTAIGTHVGPRALGVAAVSAP